MAVHTETRPMPIPPAPSVTYKQPHMELMTVTPQLARSWIPLMGPNRPIRMTKVLRLAATIQRGEWRITGSAIAAFNIDGTLVDGQHRLRAVDIADTPITGFVCFGLPADAYTVMDTGAKRTLGDFLRMDGFDHPTILANALGYLYRYINHDELTRKESSPTHDEAVALLQTHPYITASIEIGSRVARAANLSAGLLTFLHYSFSTIDREHADEFMDVLEQPQLAAADHPVRQVAGHLTTTLRKQARVGKRHDNRDVLRLLILAWNAWRHGDTTMPRWHPNDLFPTPSGITWP